MKSFRNLKPFIITVGIFLFFLFFPWEILNGITIGSFQINVDKYSNLGAFLSGITSIVAIGLIYLTYNNQITTTRISKFESTFFETLKIFNDYRLNKIYTTETKGEKQFQRIGYNYFELLINVVYANGIKSTPKEQALKKVYHIAYNPLGFYFSLLNSVLFQIESSNLNPKDKKNYIQLVSFQLSNYEKMIIENIEFHKRHENYSFVKKFKGDLMTNESLDYHMENSP